MSRILRSIAPTVGLVAVLALALPAAAGAFAADGTIAPTRAQIEALARAAGVGAPVFPVAGKYDFGTSENGFGGGRGHQGQDLLAACGTPVVAAKAGEVTVARWHAAAGNFAVVEAHDGTNHVYMHLLRPARVAVGDRVDADDRIGVVGQTGRASTCHLHFELWTAPGWYEGGAPVDPEPLLRRLAGGG
jgi:murein DD-endopeptidase MepM/ murein hydrolase activator NlpD